MNFKDISNAVESVSNERGITKEAVFEAIETALATATKRKMPEDAEIRVAIDWQNSACDTFRVWTVVDPNQMVSEQDFHMRRVIENEDRSWKDQVFNPDAHLTLAQANEKDPSLAIGDRWEEPWPSIDFGRIMAQIARQVIAQKVRDAERQHIAEEYQSRLGKLVSGSVKRQGRDFLILDLGNNVDAIIYKEHLIQRQHHRINDRVQAYLLKIDPEHKRAQLILSRTCKEMLIELFKKEVPEIAEEVIEIRAVARIPGQRAKIAVATNDGRIDAVGACVGMRGSRVQAVSSELENERIDVLVWNEDPVQLTINAMSPAVIEQIIKDEELHSMDILVRPEHHATAIGSGGENVRLASELTGWKLNIRNYEEAMKELEEKESQLTKTFMDRLQVDEDLAQVLIEENFNSLDEIAYCEIGEMLAIEGFTEEIVAILRERATLALEEEAASGVIDESQANAPSVDLVNLDGMNDAIAWQLASHGVRTVEDLADLAIPDILDMEIDIDREKAGELIMTARSPMFDNEKK